MILCIPSHIFLEKKHGTTKLDPVDTTEESCMKKWTLERLGQRMGLAPRRWSDGRDGFHPTYDEWGRLNHLSWLKNEQPGGLRLMLNHSKRHGKLVLLRGSGGTSDTEEYEHGRVTLYDAWSDNRSPSAMRWSKWVRASVVSILGLEWCLLCNTGLHHSPGVAHTKDGYSHLCAPCWRLIKTTQPHPRQWPLGERLCGGCGHRCPDETLMYVGVGGKLCANCALEVTHV
jgi:hypothetical protein